jgi:hypothetical protein
MKTLAQNNVEQKGTVNRPKEFQTMQHHTFLSTFFFLDPHKLHENFAGDDMNLIFAIPFWIMFLFFSRDFLLD